MSILTAIWYYFKLSLNQWNNYQGRSSRRAFVFYQFMMLLTLQLATAGYLFFNISAITWFFGNLPLFSQYAWSDGGMGSHLMLFHVLEFISQAWLIIGTIISLMLLVANVALIVRRLHDIGYSRWWVLAIMGCLALLLFHIFMAHFSGEIVVVSTVSKPMAIIFAIAKFIVLAAILFLCCKRTNAYSECSQTKKNLDKKQHEKIYSYCWISIKNMLNADGRSNSKTYWMTQLEFIVLLFGLYYVALFFVSVCLGPLCFLSIDLFLSAAAFMHGVLTGIYYLSIFLFLIAQPALFARRAHDFGCTAVLALLMLSAWLIGGVVLRMAMSLYNAPPFAYMFAGMMIAVGSIMYLIVVFNNSQQQGNRYAKFPVI